MQDIQSRFVVIVSFIRRSAIVASVATTTSTVIHSFTFRHATAIDGVGAIRFQWLLLWLCPVVVVIVVPDDYRSVLRRLLRLRLLAPPEDGQPDGVRIVDHRQTQSAHLVKLGWHIGIVGGAAAAYRRLVGCRGHRHCGPAVAADYAALRVDSVVLWPMADGMGSRGIRRLDLRVIVGQTTRIDTWV